MFAWALLRHWPALISACASATVGWPGRRGGAPNGDVGGRAGYPSDIPRRFQIRFFCARALAHMENMNPVHALRMDLSDPDVYYSERVGASECAKSTLFLRLSCTGLDVLGLGNGRSDCNSVRGVEGCRGHGHCSNDV